MSHRYFSTSHSQQELNKYLLFNYCSGDFISFTYSDLSDTSASPGEPFKFHATAPTFTYNSGDVFYWYGTGSEIQKSLFFQLGNISDQFTTTITISTNSTSLHYYFRFYKFGSNDTTNTKIITIPDNEEPYFGPDKSQPIATTGDTFTFRILAYDNVNIKTTTVEYWFEGGNHKIEAMTGNIEYVKPITIPSDSLQTLYYFFFANDSSTNWATSDQYYVNINDNDKPTFLVDSTSSFGSTGDDFIFSVNIEDNIGTDNEEVYVEYWYGSGTRSNISLSFTDPNFSATIIILSDSVETMHYIFHAADFSNNWVSSYQKDVTIIDDDMPIFGIDSSDQIGTTGDLFNFNISVMDNVGLFAVYLDYWFGDGIHFHYKMNGTGPYTYSIILPSGSTESLHYIFNAHDHAANEINTSQVDIAIVDNDVPEIEFFQSPTESTTGEEVIIEVHVVDNIGIDHVDITWRFGTGSIEHEVEMIPDSGLYKYVLMIPLDSTQSLYYWINATDASGLFFTTSQRTIIVIDGIYPSIEPVSDLTVTVGDSVNITIEASDNIGIDEISWEGTPFPAVENRLSGIVEQIGTYEISVSINDAAGNSVTISFNLIVLPKDESDDIDGDGMPNDWEILHHLDPEDKNDANLDPDSDDLINLEEYQAGTDPNDDDTDDDGMPDGWEVQFELDPLIYSAENDEDTDGITDLEEYEKGLNPLIINEDTDGKDDSTPNLWLIILAPLCCLILLAVLIVVLFIVVLGRRKTSKTYEE